MPTKKRAVAYIRVSTAKTEQIHSFEFQECYWKSVFQDDENVELVEIYADRGISGSSIYKRPQFQMMMQDARNNKFDVIYTKSVSRFSRNTVQLLQAVRELRDNNIEVVFETENIKTFTAGSDIYLTIAATIAENDLKVDSERQRWSIQHRCQNGWISIGSGMMGYKMRGDNTLEIVPREAEVIRKIFELYVNGTGSIKIARILNEKGYKTAHNNAWTEKAVIGILRNEKYCGETIMGKQVYINGKCYNNTNGEYGKKYYIPNSHDEIITKEMFEKAKEIRENRNKGKLDHGTVREYPFTSMIECGQCHETYNHKINNSGLKWQSAIWVCKRQHSKGLNGCDCTRIKDEVLIEKFIECYNEFIKKRPTGDIVKEKLGEIEQLKNEMRSLSELMLKGLIQESDYNEEKEVLNNKVLDIKEEISKINANGITKSDYTPMTEFNEEKMKRFITKVIINKNMVTFVFYNGAKISRGYTNGQPGNKKGWNRRIN